MQSYGKYEVVEKIGEGGFGVIYKGFDPYIKRHVAIKTCTSEEEEIRRRFFQEAEIAGNLQHRNITTVYDFGVEAGVPYLVQEYLSGEDLDRKIRRSEFIPYPEKLFYLIQVARGLDAAHANGVIHRDIKPSNVRILDDGTAKIMDFGIAKLTQYDAGLTQTGTTLGTASYLAPEQIRGESLDSRTDIFTWGLLAYELLSYTRPFQDDSSSAVLFRIIHEEPRPLSEAWPECPPELERIVDRCLRKRPGERYPDCSALLQDLDRLVEKGREERLSTDAPAEASEQKDSEHATQAIPTAAEKTRVVRRKPRLDDVVLEPGISGSVSLVPPPRRRRRSVPWLGMAAVLLVVLLAGAAWLWMQEGFDTPLSDVAAAALLRLESLAERITSGVREAAGSTADGASSREDAADRSEIPEGPPAAPESGAAPASELTASTTSAGEAAEGTELALEPARNAAEQKQGPEAVEEPEPAAVAQEPPKGTLVVPRAWDEEMTVSINGSAPHRLNRELALPLSPGTYTLSFHLITRDYQATDELQVTLEEGARRRVRIPIQRPGWLTVRQNIGSPKGWVISNTEPLGWSPVQQRILAPGRYRVRIARQPTESDEEAVSIEVGVRPDHETIVTFDLRRPHPPQVFERLHTGS